MSGVMPTLNYLELMLTQLIYIRTNSFWNALLLSSAMHGTCQFFSEFVFARLHINQTTYCPLDLSELTQVSFTKSLLELE